MIYFWNLTIDIYHIILSSSSCLAVMIATKKDIIDLILSSQFLYNIMYNVVVIYNMYIIHQARIVWRTWAMDIDYLHNHTTVSSSIERDLEFSSRFPIWPTRFFFIISVPPYQYTYLERKREQPRESIVVHLWTSGKYLPFTNT